ncbi:MAG TPA: hypothetical protein VIV60_30760, partial [Polyangiaceae bacterium]
MRGREGAVCVTIERCRRTAVCVALAAIGVGTRVSGETGPPVLLKYDAPAECPSTDYVLERISGLLRRQPATPAIAEARITKHAGGYLLQLTVDGGRRRLVSDSCDSLVETLSIIVSLAVDPRAREATSNTDAAPNVSSAPEVPSPNAPASSLPPPAPDKTTPGKTTSTEARPAAQPGVQTHRVQQGVPVRHAPPTRASSVTAPDRQNHSEASQRASQAPERREESSDPRAYAIELEPSVLFWTEYGMLPRLARGPNLSLWIDRGRFSMV